tara:strand:- start:250 stop:381 length:132 start_codon:yes stop_codon:yes gene_type:complete
MPSVKKLTKLIKIKPWLEKLNFSKKNKIYTKYMFKKKFEILRN